MFLSLLVEDPVMIRLVDQMYRESTSEAAMSA
jgi:hypothetical protein